MGAGRRRPATTTSTSAYGPPTPTRRWPSLEDAGFRTERPPEGWLYKAYMDDQLIDLIFEPAGLAVDDERSRGPTAWTCRRSRCS